MATVREAILSILKTSGALTGAGSLGSLLGHSTTTPYGVYFMNPPEKPDFPLVTYHSISARGTMPRIEGFNFTAWGDNFEAIQEVIYDLLHGKTLGVTTDVANIMLKWDWAGPDIFDANYKIYVKTVRYLQYGVKI